MIMFTFKIEQDGWSMQANESALSLITFSSSMNCSKLATFELLESRVINVLCSISVHFCRLYRLCITAMVILKEDCVFNVDYCGNCE